MMKYHSDIEPCKNCFAMLTEICSCENETEEKREIIMSETTTVVTEKKVGFAALSPEQSSELGRRGGQASQAAGKGRRFTSASAAAASALAKAKRSPSGSGAPAAAS